MSERRKRLTTAQLIAWVKERDACEEGLVYLRRTPGTVKDAWNKCRNGDHMWWLMCEAEVSSPSPGWSDDWKAWHSAPDRYVHGAHRFSAKTIREHYRWETLEGLILADINRRAK